MDTIEVSLIAKAEKEMAPAKGALRKYRNITLLS